MIGVPDFVEDAAGAVVNGVQNAGEAVVETGQQMVEAGTAIVTDPFGTAAGMLGFGEPGGNDGGSSNWAAWGHEEIRAMLDDSVHPGTIGEGAQVWGNRSREAADIMNAFTVDLRATVSGGWRGAAADAAIASLDPVDQWSASLNQAADYTTRLVDHSGSAVGQAKEMVPEPVSHSWGRTLGGLALGGPLVAGVDAVAQDRAQQEARIEAVRIMTNVYSMPINENRAAVPTYPQLADPTLQQPETPPVGGPSPGAGGSGGAGVPGGGGAAGGGAGGYQPPAVAGLQGASGGGAGSAGSGGPGPGQSGGTRPPIGGPGSPGSGGFGTQGGAAAAAGAAPFMTPMGGTGSGGDPAAARRGFGGGRGAGGGRPGGLGGLGGRAGTGAGAGSGSAGAGFGPRGSIGSAASAAEGRVGAGPAGGVAAGRGGAGGAPLMGTGAGRGQGGGDEEHRRPSYLVETDDVFGDGRKVAPPVIGEDPPEHYR